MIFILFNKTTYFFRNILNKRFSRMTENDRIEFYMDIYWENWKEIYDSRQSYLSIYKSKFKKLVHHYSTMVNKSTTTINMVDKPLQKRNAILLEE